jgi:uncharacterized C2H2 Zn-finger protein
MDTAKELKEELLLCAYCQSKFKNNTELSKHIYRIHTGLGLKETEASGKKLYQQQHY